MPEHDCEASGCELEDYTIPHTAVPTIYLGAWYLLGPPWPMTRQALYQPEPPLHSFSRYTP